VWWSQDQGTNRLGLTTLQSTCRKSPKPLQDVIVDIIEGSCHFRKRSRLPTMRAWNLRIKDGTEVAAI
jgi:hypothetical protein